MTSTKSGGADELDFRLLFGEDVQQRPAGPAESNIRSPANSTQVPGNQPIGQDQRVCLPPVLNPTPLQTSESYHHPTCQTQGSQYSFLRNPTAFGCPSIQITSISNSHAEVGSIQDNGEPIGAEGGFPEQTWSRDHLFLSLDPCYRDAALSTSPCSSLSSRSWLSDISSCESFSQICDDVEGDLNEAAARFTLGSPLTSPLASPGCGGGAFGVELWQQKYQDPHAVNQALSSHQSPRQSPCPSPRYSPCTSVTEETWLNPRPTSRSPSRPTSPGGKRRHSNADVQAHSPSPHHSPTPTPGHSPRGSVTEDTWLGSPAGAQGPLLYCCQDLDVPSKTRRTTGAQLCLLTGQKDSGIEEVRGILPVLDSPGEECGKQEDLADLFLPVPSRFSWNKPEPPSAPLFRSSSLPPLDWALPSQYGQCELKVEVQPRSHHRAHYETEGSRGSIKAVSGGHPVVKLNGYKEQAVNLQVYIGTADDRYLRPHAFYQVHRVTGKTVSTACQERFVDGSKILEMALHPEHNMSASIDCAGILKLRNADIELRKGETDIGRKNTRVRVVFRVNIPQPNDKMLCLQTASVPVECSQRSALELPQVEHFSPTSSSVDGGEEMVISGSNISCHSKVFFMEKGPDGRTRWEVDVKVVPEKSSGSRIIVKIPPYHNRTTAGHVQVQFYVSNGKRKRSQTLSFTYLDPSTDLMAGALLVKQEPSDLDYTPCNPLSSPDRAFCLDIPFHESCGQQVPYDCPFQSAYAQLGSFPLKGNQAHSGQPQMNAMNMVDLMPASQTAPHGVPYTNKSNSNVQYTDSVLANRTVQAQTNMAASISRGEALYQSPIRTNLHLPESQDSSRSSAPSFLLGHHSPLGGSGLMLKVDPHLSPSSTSSFSLHTSSGGPARQQSPSLARGRAFLTPVDPQKFPPAPHSLFCSTGSEEMMVNIKQEQKEKLSLGALALQAITLDDVNEIIDRDIYGLSSGSGQVQSDQDPCVWEEDSSETALSFCGSHQ